jgi:hypothetical protein
MPSKGALKWQSDSHHFSWIPVLFLVAILILSSRVLAATLVNTEYAVKIHEIRSASELYEDLNTGRANLGIVPELIPHASLGTAAGKWTTSRIVKEVGKQAIDQPGHFLIGATPIWISRYLVAVPWFGWVAAPILAYREWLQWPSNRWWDPPLDWIFLTLGAVVATWSRRRGHGLAIGLAVFGKSMSSDQAVRGRMTQRV